MKPKKMDGLLYFFFMKNVPFIYLHTQTKLLVGPLKRKLQDWTSLHKVKKQATIFLL